MGTYPLHVLSTGQQSLDELVKKVSQIHTDVDVFHLREKTWTAKELLKAINLLVEAGLPPEKLVVNGRVDVAHVTGARGVQLPHDGIDVPLVKESFPTLKVGCSVHTIKEAVEAEQNGADYVLFGHIYSTASKPGLPPRGLQELKAITSRISIPVIAIGGINQKNTKEVLRAGAKGIAVLSGILLADDPCTAIKKYRDALR